MAFNKLPFAYLHPQVDALFDKAIDERHTKEIDNQVQFIVDFLRANGWTEEEYAMALMNIDNIEAGN